MAEGVHTYFRVALERRNVVGYVLDNLLALGGAGLALYFLWSMVLDPAHGPLPGTVLPFAVGVVGLVVSAYVAVRGLGRIYAPTEGAEP